MHKTALVYFGGLGAAAGGDRVQVCPVGNEHLGVPIGPTASAGFEDKVTMNIRRITRHVSGLRSTMLDRVKAYMVFGQLLATYPSARLCLRARGQEGLRHGVGFHESHGPRSPTTLAELGRSLTGSRIDDDC